MKLLPSSANGDRMSDYYRTIIEQRTERRRQMTPEQRQVDALEDIADSLVAIVIAITLANQPEYLSAGWHLKMFSLCSHVKRIIVTPTTFSEPSAPG
jgi:hypothetical protein